MTQPPKPDFSGHEEEEAPFDDVTRKLLAAKPKTRTSPVDPASDPPPEADFA